MNGSLLVAIGANKIRQDFKHEIIRIVRKMKLWLIILIRLNSSLSDEFPASLTCRLSQ